MDYLFKEKEYATTLRCRFHHYGHWTVEFGEHNPNRLFKVIVNEAPINIHNKRDFTPNVSDVFNVVSSVIPDQLPDTDDKRENYLAYTSHVQFNLDIFPGMKGKMIDFDDREGVFFLLYGRDLQKAYRLLDNAGYRKFRPGDVFQEYVNWKSVSDHNDNWR